MSEELIKIAEEKAKEIIFLASEEAKKIVGEAKKNNDVVTDELITDIVYRASQSTKQENSGLIGDLKKMIEKNNHAVDSLLTDFQAHKTVVYAHFEKDEEWKKTATPVIEMGQNVQGFGKVSLYILGFFASVSGAILLIIKYLHSDK